MTPLKMLATLLVVFAAAIPVSAQTPIVLDPRLALTEVGYQPVAPINFIGSFGFGPPLQGATMLFAGIDAAGGFYQQIRETLGECSASPNGQLTRSTIDRVGLFGVNRGVVSITNQCIDGQATNLQLTPLGVFFFGLPDPSAIHVLVFKQSAFVFECPFHCRLVEKDIRFFAVHPIDAIYFE